MNNKTRSKSINQTIYILFVYIIYLHVCFVHMMMLFLFCDVVMLFAICADIVVVVVVVVRQSKCKLSLRKIDEKNKNKI